jgi:cytochrome c oxidase subunit 2
LFGLTALLGAGIFLYAPLDGDWWLPNYPSTNQRALQALRTTAQELVPLRETQSAITSEAGSALAARDENPERWTHLERRQRDVRTKLEPHRDSLAKLAGQSILAGQTRKAANGLDAAIAAMDRAARDLASGRRQEAITLLRTAQTSIEEATGEVEAALASVSVPASRIARDVDHLFVIILVITGIVFVLTEVALVYSTWRFGAGPGRRAVHTHGSTRLEILWTAIPAAVLVFIAVYQLRSWAEIKFPSYLPQVQPLAEVSSRQFQWIIRYAGADGRIGTVDDLITVNDLHFIKGQPTVIHLKSEDVIHSFYLPQLRVKQDAVPGLTIPLWFDADKSGRYELICAELCGWGHYKMRANVTVHENSQDFQEWLDSALREQNLDRPPHAQPAISTAAFQGR